jgi:hypothetical protein
MCVWGLSGFPLRAPPIFLISPIDRRFHPDETFQLHLSMSLYNFYLLFNFDHSFTSFKHVIMQTVMQQRYEIYRSFDDDMAC